MSAANPGDEAAPAAGETVPDEVVPDEVVPDEVQLTGLEHVRARSAELFTVQRDADGSAAIRSVARDDLVHLHLSLVEHCARRFRNRGEIADIGYPPTG